MEEGYSVVSAPKLTFEILIDESFVNLASDKSLTPIENKSVLSLINDFEDTKWRYQKFQNFIWDNIAETALSFKERQSLANQSHTSLKEAAKKLQLLDKDSTGEGSELAEILLYGIMKHHYKALPVVPKIFYKQNTQDPAKGSDSVHIVIESSDFSIWFGEAKFYNSIEDSRLGKIVETVEKSLHTDKLKKENSIITNISDLDFLVLDAALKEKIRKLLSHETSIDELKPKLHVPILILHECNITSGTTSLSEEYKEKIKEFHKQRAESYFKKQLNKICAIHKYSDIRFHVILFPVPVKKEIVDKFISTVGFYKN